MAKVQQLHQAPILARPVSITSTPAAAIDMDVDVDSGRSLISPALNGVKSSSGLQRGDTRTAVIVHGPGQEKIVSVFADVLGKPYRIADSFRGIASGEQDVVLGMSLENAKVDISTRKKTSLVAIHAHCVDLGMPPDTYLSAHCDYEFLYTETQFFRRDLARFLSTTLGQINRHDALMSKPRTYFLSMTFPDVRAALSNIDILTVGADAVELRVDLLKEPLSDGTFAQVPSLSYVGEQVMLLRQRTELPIIFTTRCTRENGQFPMDNPDLYYDYLYRAIQWGVEYVDVELWLPERIRQRLYEQRGNSRIMSAFHDFSGTFKWPSAQAQSIFLESRKYADIVKMIAIINDHNENFELEYFRSKIQGEYPDSPPLSAVNMGETGQFSRTLNKVFTPITHPLLPTIAAPGQMSAAEINAALSLLGQLPKRNIYGITTPFSRIATPYAPFYEKCFNELGLPHNFAVVERQLKGPGCVEGWCNQKAFGGAYLSPPVSFSSLMHNSSFFSRLSNGSGPALTEAARMIAYLGRTAVVLASHADEAASAIYALKALRIRKLYTVGFKTPLVLARGLLVEPFNSLESLQRARMVGDDASPFVIVSALGPEKSNIVGMLVRLFGGSRGSSSSTRKVFLDLADGPRKGDPSVVAEQSGFAAYGVADTAAFTTVETLRLLVGQNVPYSFVRLASGRGVF
ncbi:hypothetical protein DL770_005970 [Monosporascus sp. CRB-9-2]|nr:hypothetical protein DL770_005970 [Monosporascus sp. CRB-9-2]